MRPGLLKHVPARTERSAATSPEKRICRGSASTDPGARRRGGDVTRPGPSSNPPTTQSTSNARFRRPSMRPGWVSGPRPQRTTAVAPSAAGTLAHVGLIPSTETTIRAHDTSDTALPSCPFLFVPDAPAAHRASSRRSALLDCGSVHATLPASLFHTGIAGPPVAWELATRGVWPGGPGQLASGSARVIRLGCSRMRRRLPEAIQQSVSVAAASPGIRSLEVGRSGREPCCDPPAPLSLRAFGRPV